MVNPLGDSWYRQQKLIFPLRPTKKHLHWESGFPVATLDYVENMRRFSMSSATGSTGSVPPSLNHPLSTLGQSSPVNSSTKKVRMIQYWNLQTMAPVCWNWSPGSLFLEVSWEFSMPLIIQHPRQTRQDAFRGDRLPGNKSNFHPSLQWWFVVLQKKRSGKTQRHFYDWLVVSTPLKNISQLGWLFPIYGKIKNVPNHQPEYEWGSKYS